MCHPRGVGAAEVMTFLTMLAADRRVSSSTHEQALSALLFLYKDVLQSGNTFCALPCSTHCANSSAICCATLAAAFHTFTRPAKSRS
ncbi:hypothetical protein B9Z48_11295 [Limnohabitans sp. WS1]|nr:hypothetical protein B9Z48_11295 [Limnohabitans sp. WS1]